MPPQALPLPDPPVRQRLTERLAELPADLLESALESLGWSGAVTPEHFAGELAPTILAGCAALFSAMDEGRHLTRAEVAGLITPAVERLIEYRVPLPTLISAVHGGIEQLWRVICATTSGDEAVPNDGAAWLAACGGSLVHSAGTLATVLAETYQNADPTLLAAECEARRMLCSTLLRGESPIDLVAHVGHPVSDSYGVLTFRTCDATSSSGTGDAFVARRRMRQAQHVLDELGVAGVLSTFDGYVGAVLVPVNGTGPGADDWRRLRHVVAELADRLGVEIYGAAQYAPSQSDIPAAAAETTEVSYIARQLSRPAGLYRLDDVLFEYQITRPGPARDALAQLIAPLRQHPQLLQTLRVHVKHGADRKAAAAEMFVHPNTLSYRLRRIADLTGMNPGDPADDRVLSAALSIDLIDDSLRD